MFLNYRALLRLVLKSQGAGGSPPLQGGGVLGEWSGGPQPVFRVLLGIQRTIKTQNARFYGTQRTKTPKCSISATAFWGKVGNYSYLRNITPLYLSWNGVLGAVLGAYIIWVWKPWLFFTTQCTYLNNWYWSLTSTQTLRSEGRRFVRNQWLWGLLTIFLRSR